MPSDDDAASDSGAEHSNPHMDDNTGTVPPTAPPTSGTDHIPSMGHGIRGWAPVDENELIAYKKDTRSRHSWKVIESKLYRDPESCRARLYWLKSSCPELATTADNADPID